MSKAKTWIWAKQEVRRQEGHHQVSHLDSSYRPEMAAEPNCFCRRGLGAGIAEQIAYWQRSSLCFRHAFTCRERSRLLADLKELCSTFVAGDGFNPEVNLTALCYKRHADAVFEYIQSGIDEGARLITGGKPYTEPHLQKGFFVPVTILADVTPDMKVFQEEIFGPVLCVTPFKDEADAIRLAMTDFGLAGGVHAEISEALRVARAMHGGQLRQLLL